MTAGAEAFTFPEGRAVAAHDRLKNSKSWTLNFGEQPKNPNQGCMEEKFSIHKIAVCVPLFAFPPRYSGNDTGFILMGRTIDPVYKPHSSKRG